MAALDRYQNRYQQRYGIRTQSKGGRYLKRAQSNYLHFHTTSITATPPVVIQDAKDQILRDFAYGMKKNSQQLDSGPLKNMSFEEIRQWLGEWTSGDTGGIIGQEMGNAIAEKLQNDPYTGAGILKGFNDTFSSNGKISTSGESLANQADYVMDTMWEYLDRYANIFFSNGEDALLLKCLEIAHTGMNNGNSKAKEIWSKYNNQKISLQGQNTLSKKVSSNFSKMEEILDTLQQVSSMGHGGAGRVKIGNSFNGKQKWNPKTLARQLGSIFNAIGGEQVGEIVGAAAAIEVLQTGNKDVIAKATQCFKQSGAIVFSTAKTGEDTIQLENSSLPIQQKGDWSILIRKGNVTIVIPVSSKLYQSGSVNGLNYTPIGEPFTGTVSAQMISLEQLLAITLEGSPEWLEQHMAALSRIPNGRMAYLDSSGDPAAAALWQEFKEAAKYTGLFRALVGTGATTKTGIDFAALFVVNSQVFSMADILKQFIKNPALFSSSKGNGPDTIPDWPEVRSKVAGPYYGQAMSDIDITERLQTQYSAIRSLYGKKYNFELNMGMLTGAL